jgi:hypothetical protein
MPEVSTRRHSRTGGSGLRNFQIAEISRIVHYLKKHAVGKTVEAVKTQEDTVGNPLALLCFTSKQPWICSETYYRSSMAKSAHRRLNSRSQSRARRS